MRYLLNGGSTFRAGLPIVPFVAAMVLLGVQSLKAHAENLEQDSLPTAQDTMWRDFLFWRKNVGSPVSSSISPHILTQVETIPPPAPTDSTPAPVSPSQQSDVNLTNEKVSIGTKGSTTVIPNVSVPDPPLFLNFSLTMGQVPDPRSSVYNTVQNKSETLDILIHQSNASGTSEAPQKTVITSESPTSKVPTRFEFTERPLRSTTTKIPNFKEVDELDNRTQLHPCNRKCIAGAPPMRCRYFFVQEWYQTMSKACYACPLNRSHCDLEHCIPGDGIQRTIVVVNRTLPGPSIQVCLGDEIEVILENAMPEESASLHWHGLHQKGTPHADGVPFVTQCPITPGSTYTYLFNASTPGTHFWHSHAGLQRGDGNFGALIIRVPKEQDPHAEIYDTDKEEHIMQIMDWGHQLGILTFVSHHHGDGDNKPSSILVNGKGRYRPFPSDASTIGNRSAPVFHPYPVKAGARNKLSNTTYTPVSVFKVKRGIRHRFRLINAGFLNCPIQLSVDNHTLLIISSDGGDIEPVKADSLVSYAGERFDFILIPEWERDDTEIGRTKRFWARFRGLMVCDERFDGVHQIAIVEYETDEPDGSILDFKLIHEEDPPGEVSYEAADRQGLTFNALNVGAGADGSHSVAELHAIGLSLPAPDDPVLKPKADMTFYLGYDLYEKDNPIYHIPKLYGFRQVLDDRQRLPTPQLNHISLQMPSFPILTQRDILDNGGYDLPHFCNETSLAAEGKNCSSRDFCQCTHLLSVPLGSVVELILIDEGVAYDANHPFHLHGHSFRVLGMGRVGRSVTVDKVKLLDKLGYIQRRVGPLKPALKDTVTVPDGGYTVVRFHATNPGYWLFHCHIGFHGELGMALIFKVGEHKDFAPVPSRFPQCGSWTPLAGNEKQESYEKKRSEKIKVDENESGGGGFWFFSSSSNVQPHWKLSLIIVAILLMFSLRQV